jgi:hypothetical protein
MPFVIGVEDGQLNGLSPLPMYHSILPSARNTHV